MKKVLALMAVLALVAGPALAHHSGGHGTGNNGNGVGNTGLGNQGNGPNSGTAGNAGGNNGSGGNHGGGGNSGGGGSVDTGPAKGASPSYGDGNCRTNECNMERSDDVISRKVGPHIDNYIFRHLQDLFDKLF